jgi:transaldolase
MANAQQDESERVDRSRQTDARAEPERPEDGADRRRRRSRLHELSELGQSVWIDFLSRQLLQSGELARMMEDDAVVGITSNPTIFQKAISSGDDYDEQLREVLAEEDDPKEVFLRLAVQDVRDACDVLRQVWDGGGGKDGYVSIEVDPNFAYDTDATIGEAQRLHEVVDRPNCFVKIPGTKPGLPAIEEMIARGRSINVTLIFSLQRYSEVMKAFIHGLEGARDAGRDLSRLTSVASFFVSRVDTEIDKRLDKIGTEEAKSLKGKAAIANARLAYQLYEQVFATDVWSALARAGGQPQRPLWASTGVKDPAYDDTMYVVDLVAPGVVNTMPEATLNAVADHGVISGDTIRPHYAHAKQVLDDLATAGIDYDDVVQVLEDEGVEKFETSWNELLESTKSELTRFAKESAK